MEKRLTDSAPEQAELQQDLEDANAQLVEERRMKEEYREQVSQVLKLVEHTREIREDDEVDEQEDKGSHIAKFSGVDRFELRGWKVQLTLRFAGKARTYNTE